MTHLSFLAHCLRLSVYWIRILPPGLVQTFGQRLGYAFGHLPLRDVKRCREHLRRAFPQASDDWVHKTCCRCFGHFGRNAFILLRLLSVPKERIIKHVRVEGLENMLAHRHAWKCGEGTVLVGGHFGNWELQMRFMGMAGDMYSIGRRMPDADLDNFIIEHLRTHDNNAKVIYQDQGLLPAIRALRQAGSVCMVPDQDLPKIPGLFSSWFNIPAWTPSGPAKLARSQGVAIQPVFFYEHGRKFVFHWGPRKHFKKSNDEEKDVQYMTDWIMAYQEQLVRRHPEQWVWWHRRWRTRPEQVN